jgi:hypothetical protein
MALALAFAASLSYAVMHFLGPAAIWRRCEGAYARAGSAADTARVDQLSPAIRNDVAPIACGELRVNRTGGRDEPR